MPPTFSPFFLFVFTTLPVSPFLAVNAQTDRFIVGQATMTEAPISPSVLVPTPVFKSAINSVLGTGLLGGRVRYGRFASSRPR